MVIKYVNLVQFRFVADKIEQGLFVYKGLRCEAHSYKLLFDVICNFSLDKNDRQRQTTLSFNHGNLLYLQLRLTVLVS